MKKNQVSQTNKKKASSQFHDNIINTKIRDLLYTNNMKAEDLVAKFKENNIIITKEAVRLWTGGYARPDIDKLLIIAKIFDCSMDYLFGITEYPTSNEDIKAIINYTGLSEEAVIILNVINTKKNTPVDIPFQSEPQLYDDLIKAINLLIEKESENKILENIARYLWYEYKDISDKQNIYVKENKRGIMYPIKNSDINKIALINVEETLFELKIKFNKDKEVQNNGNTRNSKKQEI